MTDERDRLIVDAMSKFGGGFARKIAEACQAADDENFQRLKQAFPELWERYARIVAQLEANKERL